MNRWVSSVYQWLRRFLGRLGVRVFAAYFLVLGLATYGALRYFSDAVKPAVRQTIEEMQVEEANLLAAMLETEGRDNQDGVLVPKVWWSAHENFQIRRLNARIYGVDKTRTNQRTYVTDAFGVVRFDSLGEALGQDYSSWRNVKLTLEGRYGARSSHDGPNGTSILHISAPIYKQQKIVGVVTIAKPVADFDPFVHLARVQMLRIGLTGMAISLGIGLLLSWLLTRSVSRLVDYAEVVASGKRAAKPSTYGEFQTLSAAMERMRVELEGKRYVEHAMQTFAHEVKSPIAAIVASAEVLEDALPEADRVTFAKQIAAQAKRMQDLLESLLHLAIVEQRQGLEKARTLRIKDVLEESWQLAAPPSKASRLSIKQQTDADLMVSGEHDLLLHAARNLFANALAFAEPHSTIAVSLTAKDDVAIIRIHNRGPAIPPFAEAKIFERFFSLPRPDGQNRSSGIGLAFVHEVTQLHGGTIRLANEEEGVAAYWTLPRG
jgi:two-component system, OmpR family, sensor histidine kinase CreC